ncbi:MAG TPA: hypothetical protein VIF09_10125 [Polyangiaceae bacterium]|jgi:ABC-type amino acid transport substrate-binding protein
MTDGEDREVRLDATGADVEVPAAIAAQLPLASTLPPGTRLTVLPTATRKAGALRRLFGDRGVPVPRWSRCSALLARGYVDVCAAGDSVWARSPASPTA